MRTQHPLGITVSVHVNESTLLEAKAHYAGHGFALVSVTDGHVSVTVFFQTVADIYRTIDAMKQARHELAALTESESDGVTAEGTQVATHAHAA